jgi:hypothetical protein
MIECNVKRYVKNVSIRGRRWGIVFPITRCGALSWRHYVTLLLDLLELSVKASPSLPLRRS